MFKLSKVKGGNVAYMKKLSNITKSGKGTPAVKKLPEQEINKIENEYNNTLKGKGVSKYKKSIKPLQFKI